MKKIAFFLVFALNVIVLNAQKIDIFKKPDIDKQLDIVLNKFESKLDSSVSIYTGKIEMQVNQVQSKLDTTISNVNSQLQGNLAMLKNDIIEIKAELLKSIGQITWQFMMVDVVISLVSVILTALFTAYLTSRRLRIRKDIQAMMDETAETVKAAMAEVGNNDLIATIKALQSQNTEILKQLAELQNKK